MASNEKTAKKKKHSSCSFQRTWSTQYPCIQPTSDKLRAKCTICDCSFNIHHQGLLDVKRHIGGSQHQKLAKDVAASTSIDTFYVSGSTEVEKVTNAEVLFTGFILEHNLPFECSSHAGPLFRKMFPDSKIAAKYGCAATKTACIISHAIAPSLHFHLLDLLRAEPFSLSVDGSSDTGTESMYPLVVKVYDINRGEISSLFWNMALISDCSAAGIFQKVSDIFEKESIPWENCIGLSLDNASVNMGKHKGLFTHFMKKNDSNYTLDVPAIFFTILQRQDQMHLLEKQVLMLVTS